MVVYGDPLIDWLNIIKDKYSTTTGGVKPKIELGQNLRYIPVNTGADYIYIINLTEGDDFFGIGGVDYRRNVTFTVVIRTATSRVRARQMVEECRKVIRTKANWYIYDDMDEYMYQYLDAKMSNTVDNSDGQRKVWHFQVDVNTFRIENVNNI